MSGLIEKLAALAGTDAATVVLILGAVAALASAISLVTPTEADNKIVDKVIQVADRFGFIPKDKNLWSLLKKLIDKLTG